MNSAVWHYPDPSSDASAAAPSRKSPDPPPPNPVPNPSARSAHLRFERPNWGRREDPHRAPEAGESLAPAPSGPPPPPAATSRNVTAPSTAPPRPPPDPPADLGVQFQWMRDQLLTVSRERDDLRARLGGNTAGRAPAGWKVPPEASTALVVPPTNAPYPGPRGPDAEGQLRSARGEIEALKEHLRRVPKPQAMQALQTELAMTKDQLLATRAEMAEVRSQFERCIAEKAKCERDLEVERAEALRVAADLTEHRDRADHQQLRAEQLEDALAQAQADFEDLGRQFDAVVSKLPDCEATPQRRHWSPRRLFPGHPSPPPSASLPMAAAPLRSHPPAPVLPPAASAPLHALPFTGAPMLVQMVNPCAVPNYTMPYNPLPVGFPEHAAPASATGAQIPPYADPFAFSHLQQPQPPSLGAPGSPRTADASRHSRGRGAHAPQEVPLNVPWAVIPRSQSQVYPSADTDYCLQFCARVGLGIRVLEKAFDAEDGVLDVVTVTPQSAAERAGIRPGDRIEKWNHRVIATREQFQDAVKGTPSPSALRLGLTRRGIRKQVILDT